MKIFVIIERYTKKDPWRVARQSRGGLDIRAYGTRKEAAVDLYQLRQHRQPGCVKLVPAAVGFTGELELEIEL